LTVIAALVGELVSVLLCSEMKTLGFDFGYFKIQNENYPGGTGCRLPLNSHKMIESSESV